MTKLFIVHLFCSHLVFDLLQAESQREDCTRQRREGTQGIYFWILKKNSFPVNVTSEMQLGWLPVFPTLQ